MTPPSLLTDIREGVLTLALNRPEKRNAIDNGLASALLDALDAACRDESVRVVMLRGNGRAFCAGRDITSAPTDEDLVLVQAVSRAIVELPKPVVAAVQGWAVGAGLEWMLDADLVVAASDARFKLPEASLGVFVTGGLTATLAASAGLARAKALMLLGDAFTAADAQAWGVVWRVVAPQDLEAESRRVADQLAALQPAVASRFKKVLNEVGLAHFARAIDLENAAQRAIASGQAAAGGAGRAASS